MKNKWIKLAGVTMAVAGLSMSVQAVAITGSIAFGGSAAVNNANLSLATAFTSISAYANPGQEFGSYTPILGFTGITFTPFTFSPPAGSVTPLWTVTVSGIVYDFNATSMTSIWDAAHNQWNMGGNGIAQITGFTDTAGTWNATVGSAGSSFFFGAATVPNVPDGGATVMLLGAALSAMGLLRRKLIA